MFFDPEIFGRAMGEAIVKQIAPLKERINSLEKQLAEVALAQENQDRKGRDMAAVRAMVEEAVKAIPAPAAGKDGANGKDGASVTLEDVRPLIAEFANALHDEVSQKLDSAIKNLPVPKDGRDGNDGQNGEKGADGAGIADLLTDRDGALVATFTDGRMKNLGVIVGKDGRDGVDGRDGKDGIGLEEFELEYLPDSHEISVKAACAGRVKEMRYPAGGIRPAGYWREGTKAKAGEAWVHDGSMYIATEDTAEKPAPNAKGWIIGARRGRDGERGPSGAPAAPPAPIKLDKKP